MFPVLLNVISSGNQHKNQQSIKAKDQRYRHGRLRPQRRQCRARPHIADVAEAARNLRQRGFADAPAAQHETHEKATVKVQAVAGQAGA